MGKFANELEGGFGLMGELAIRPEPEVKDGFDAFGHEVPGYRRDAAYHTAKSFGLTNEQAAEVVGIMADNIARDNPHQAMERALGYVDVIGVYRLLAVLCTATKPTVRIPAKSSK